MIPPSHPIFTAYLSRLDRKMVVEGTRYNAERWLGRFEVWCRLNHLEPESVTQDDLDAYLDSLVGFSEGSKRLCRIQLKAAYRYAHRRGVLRADPTIDLFNPIQEDIEPQTFTNQELRQIIAACRTERESLAVHLLAYTMMRRSEVRNLKWEDVDLSGQTITVRKGKGRKLRLVPIHAALGEILAAAKPNAKGSYVISNEHRDEAVQDTTWDQIVKPILKRAGVQGTAHVFRKTLSSDLVEQGVAESHIDQIGGWAPRSVRERHYLRVAPDYLIAAIHKAYQNDPISTVKQRVRRVA
jgi:integrase